MNCKKGDLAVIVRTGERSRNLLGRVIRVTTLAPAPATHRDLPAWLYEGEPLKCLDGGVALAIHDFCLRPLRNSKDEDETLTWAGKPEGVSA